MNNTSSKIETLFQQTKTVCFGRFMIDLPQSAQLVWGPMAVPYKMSVFPGQGHKIKAQIKATVDEMSSEKHRTEPSMLIGVFDSVNPDSKIVVGYNNQTDSIFVKLDSFIRLGNTAFVQSISRAGMGYTDTDGTRKLNKYAYKQEVAYLLKEARLLRLRNENEIPSEHGVCIEEGFIAVPLDYRTERIAIGFRFPELPDVTLSVATRNTDQPSEYGTLKAAREAGREAAMEMGLGSLYRRIKTLREQNRTIGQWEGAEALSRLPSNRDIPETHEFNFISPGSAKDLLRPHVRIKLYTGVKENSRGQVPPSLTDAEAIALWDKLTSTIRVRPVK